MFLQLQGKWIKKKKIQWSQCCMLGNGTLTLKSLAFFLVKHSQFSFVSVTLRWCCCWQLHKPASHQTAACVYKQIWGCHVDINLKKRLNGRSHLLISLDPPVYLTSRPPDSDIISWRSGCQWIYAYFFMMSWVQTKSLFVPLSTSVQNHLP